MPTGCYWFLVFVLALIAMILTANLVIVGFVVLGGIVVYFLGASTGGNNNPPSEFN